MVATGLLEEQLIAGASDRKAPQSNVPHDRKSAAKLLKSVIKTLDDIQQGPEADTQTQKALDHNIALAGTLIAPRNTKYAFLTTGGILSALDLFMQRDCKPLTMQHISDAGISGCLEAGYKPELRSDTRHMMTALERIHQRRF